MNTDELDALGDWDEGELAALVGRFVRVFHRLPGVEDFVALRRARAGLGLEVSAQRAAATAMRPRAEAPDTGDPVAVL